MAKKKELDNLSLDMIQCKKDGYGCHYGKWKVMQGYEERPKQLPEGWKICVRCGTWYKPKQNKHNQKYCGAYCQMEAQKAKDREKTAQYMREYRGRRKEREYGEE